MKFKYIRASALGAVVACSTMFSGMTLAANDSMLELLKVLRDNGTITAEAYSVLANSAKADQERTDAKIDEVAEQMLDRRVGSALVMDGGFVVGIFTATDALRFLCEWFGPNSN